jgi:hypothetical protein
MFVGLTDVDISLSLLQKGQQYVKQWNQFCEKMF